MENVDLNIVRRLLDIALAEREGAKKGTDHVEPAADTVMAQANDSDPGHEDPEDNNNEEDPFGLPRAKRAAYTFHDDEPVGTPIPAWAAGFYERFAPERRLKDASLKRLRKKYPIMAGGDTDAIPEVDSWLASRKAGAKATIKAVNYDADSARQRSKWTLQQHASIACTYRADKIREYLASEEPDVDTAIAAMEKLIADMHDTIAIAMDGRAGLERNRKRFWAEALNMSAEIKEIMATKTSEDPREMFGDTIKEMEKAEADKRRDDLITATLTAKKRPTGNGNGNSFRKPVFSAGNPQPFFGGRGGFSRGPPRPMGAMPRTFVRKPFPPFSSAPKPASNE